ncbi:MAG: type II secretion system F family protein [Miltoncostaeaceae bacterium]
MSLAADPWVLLVAAGIALLLGLRARRPSVAGGPPPRRLPAPVSLGLRVPVPRRLIGAGRRDGDEALLARAGLESVVGPGALAHARVGCGALALVVAAPLVVVAPAAGVLLLPAAALIPLLVGRAVAARARTRSDAVVGELPDLLDLLAICVESGMAVDPALGLGAERLGGALGEEVGRVLEDLRLGTPRRPAYEALARRVGAPEVVNVVGALLQAEELGAPLSRTLTAQAAALRAGRRQWARDRAAAAAPKIQLVVALVMVPAVLLLVLGVMVIEFSRQVGAVIGGGG